MIIVVTGHDSKLKGLSTGLYMYLANPLTIVLHMQLDIAIETIVMKVISRKLNEKGVIAESSGWRPPLHSASAAFCERLTLFNRYNALWVQQLPVGTHEWGDLEPGQSGHLSKSFTKVWWQQVWTRPFVMSKANINILRSCRHSGLQVSCILHIKYFCISCYITIQSQVVPVSPNIVHNDFNENVLVQLFLRHIM